MKKLFTLFCGILLTVAMVATASTQVVKIWHEGQVVVTQALSAIQSLSFYEANGSYYVSMHGESDGESMGSTNQIYVGDSLTFESVDVYSSRPEGYSKEITENVYQNDTNTDMYVVKGSADSMWHEMVDLGVKTDDGKAVLFATTNLGATATTESGGFYTFDEAQTSVTSTWGSEFSVPTQTELVSLNDNCTNSYANGGMTFTSKTNEKASIFLPAAGHTEENKPLGTDYGYYWSSTVKNKEEAYCFCYMENRVITDECAYFTYGLCVRPVAAVDLSGNAGSDDSGMPAGYTTKISDNCYRSTTSDNMYIVKGSVDGKWHEMVDIGVTTNDHKSVLFATTNLGASTSTECGTYYLSENAQTAPSTEWGTEFRLPTRDEYERISKKIICNMSSEDGGLIFTNKYDTKASIFLPATGLYYTSNRLMDSEYCYYWSSTQGNNGGYYAFYADGTKTMASSYPKNASMPVRAVAEVETAL